MATQQLLGCLQLQHRPSETLHERTLRPLKLQRLMRAMKRTTGLLMRVPIAGRMIIWTDDAIKHASNTSEIQPTERHAPNSIYPEIWLHIRRQTPLRL